MFSSTDERLIHTYNCRIYLPQIYLLAEIVALRKAFEAELSRLEKETVKNNDPTNEMTNSFSGTATITDIDIADISLGTCGF